MANKTQTIRIESIFGGKSPLTHFSQSDQFLDSINIDPARSIGIRNSGEPLDDLNIPESSGMIMPVVVQGLRNSSFIDQRPVFLVNNPKRGDVYAYGALGSVYVVYTDGSSSETAGALSDGGSMSGVGISGGGLACGAGYYDNYIYFAKNTTVARYGPLDGTPAFDGNFWAGTLGLTELTHDSNRIYYPIDSLADSYPQHVMHRHNDGRLYIVDIVNGSGVLHYIETTKSSTEGDTNNGSKYNAIDFGFGLIPTAIESYGSDLVIALFESQSDPGFSNGNRGQKARIAIWDTTSASMNFITNNEFPDEFISAMRNVNGTIFIASGQRLSRGTRISRYIGGYSFEEVLFVQEGHPPYPGALISEAGRLIFGSKVIYSLGLNNRAVGNGIFKFQHTGAAYNDTSNTYSLLSYPLSDFATEAILAGWEATIPGPSGTGVDIIGGGTSGTVSGYQAHWYSQIYKVGSPFKITRIRVPLPEKLEASVGISFSIYTDDGNTSYSLTAINSTNWGTNTSMLTFRPQNAVGDNNFFLAFTWTDTEKKPIGLPITIEYELLDVDTAYQYA